MAEGIPIKMVNSKGRQMYKVIKTSCALTATVKLPSNREWKLIDEEIIMSGEIFTGFFLLEELDDPYAITEGLGTITKHGCLLVYKTENQGYMINLKQATSVSTADIPFSETSGKWLDRLFIAICMLFPFGKIIMMVEKQSSWIQAIGQYIPCPVDETSLYYPIDVTDSEEEETDEEEEHDTAMDISLPSSHGTNLETTVDGEKKTDEAST